MKEFAKQFYKSKQWQHCRDNYLKSVGGLCENCLQNGKYVPAVIVHHVINITQQNITNPEITLNWDNLRCVCRECHAQEHSHKPRRRYEVDEYGRVIGSDLTSPPMAR